MVPGFSCTTSLTHLSIYDGWQSQESLIFSSGIICSDGRISSDNHNKEETCEGENTCRRNYQLFWCENQGIPGVCTHTHAGQFICFWLIDLPVFSVLVVKLPFFAVWWISGWGDNKSPEARSTICMHIHIICTCTHSQSQLYQVVSIYIYLYLSIYQL